MFTNVFFDLDGTIVDSTEAILDAFKTAFSLKSLTDEGLKYPGDEKLINLFGKSLRDILDDFDIPKNLQLKFTRAFINDEMKSNKFRLFEGIAEILNLIKQKKIPLVIVTSKGSETANYVLDLLNIDPKVLITSDIVDKTKPDPEPLLMACMELGIEPSSNIAYIGDSLHDMKAAESANMTPIGVSWGAHGKKIEDHNYKLFNNSKDLEIFLRNKIK